MLLRCHSRPFTYAVYDLPFGRGKLVGKDVNRVVNEVIGGWAVSPIVSFRTRLAIAGLRSPGRIWDIRPRSTCRLQRPPVDYQNIHTGSRRSVVHQYWTVYQSCSWLLRQLLTATRWAAFASLHRRRHEFAQRLPNQRAVAVAVPNRLHQRFQPCPIQRTQHGLGIHDGTDYRCPTSKKHTVGAKTLLLKIRHV